MYLNALMGVIGMTFQIFGWNCYHATIIMLFVLKNCRRRNHADTPLLSVHCSQAAEFSTGFQPDCSNDSPGFSGFSGLKFFMGFQPVGSQKSQMPIFSRCWRSQLKIILPLMVFLFPPADTDDSQKRMWTVAQIPQQARQKIFQSAFKANLTKYSEVVLNLKAPGWVESECGFACLSNEILD